MQSAVGLATVRLAGISLEKLLDEQIVLQQATPAAPAQLAQARSSSNSGASLSGKASLMVIGRQMARAPSVP
jgi:hypothetical protein